MPLAIPQIILGTQVAITHAEDGETLLPVERRGVIVAVDTAKRIEKDPKTGRQVITVTVRNGNPACGVKTIWVRLKQGAEPVAVKNCQLTLIHEANRKTYDEIKRQDAVKQAEALETKRREMGSLEELVVIPDDALPEADDQRVVFEETKPVVVQELGVPEGRGLTAEEIRALEAGDEPLPPEPSTKLERVLPKQ